MITKWKYFDLLTNSLNILLKEIYGDHWRICEWISELKGVTAFLLFQGPVFYLALFHGNLYLVYSANLTTPFVPVISSGETLNDGAYHTVKIELGGSG